MKESVLVSVIINNYNYGRFLQEAIDSAISQTYAHVEVIVVDDGSTDNSPDIIRGYPESIITIVKENGGQASTFNAGFKKSKGEIIIFLDSDDILFPAAVENIVAALNEPGIAKLHWSMWRINERGERTGGIVPQCTLVEGNLIQEIVHHGPDRCGGPPFCPPTSGNAWSRQFLEKVLPMPEPPFKLGADQYLFVLAPLFGALRKLPDPQGCYRIHGTNDTLKPLTQYMREFFARYEYCCLTLKEFLEKKEVDVNPAIWTRNSWYHQVHAAMQDITAIVPPSTSFILVDDNLWTGTDFGAERRRIPFLERDGEYWGLPADDENAIQELERLRKAGAGLIAFAWFSFWWLDHYSVMYDYLKSNYTCKVKNEWFVVYNL